MGLYRVAVLASCLFLIQCNLYQARAVQKESTYVKMKIPFSSLTISSGPDDENTNDKKPPDSVVRLPKPGSSEKYNFIINTAGTKGCQYTPPTMLVEKNQTMNIDVYVHDNEDPTDDSDVPEYLTTSSKSEIKNGKSGMKIIGFSKSSTPHSKLTITVVVYTIDDGKNDTTRDTITTNTALSDNQGDKSRSTARLVGDGSKQGESITQSTGSGKSLPPEEGSNDKGPPKSSSGSSPDSSSVGNATENGSLGPDSGSSPTTSPVGDATDSGSSGPDGGSSAAISPAGDVTNSGSSGSDGGSSPSTSPDGDAPGSGPSGSDAGSPPNSSPVDSTDSGSSIPDSGPSGHEPSGADPTDTGSCFREPLEKSSDIGVDDNAAAIGIEYAGKAA